MRCYYNKKLKMIDKKNIQEWIAYGRGERPVDLLVNNVRVVNVLSGEIHAGPIAIAGGRFIGIGDYPAHQTVDGRGRYMCPALIEGHIHVESSMLCMQQFARQVARCGTAAVVCDPHEIANVLGSDGIEYMLAASCDLPVAVYFMLPSCVPATHLEHAGAKLGAAELNHLLANYPDRFLGLAEMMNYPGVLFRDPAVMDKLALANGRVIDGHCPQLSGWDLNAYILAGPTSEHEAVSQSEAREKLRKGMHIFMREGSHEHNLKTLLPIVNDDNSAHVSIVSDDRDVQDLVENGHLNNSVRKAIAWGISPMRAIQMTTINTARYFGLRDHGAIAPGYRADFLLLNDLKTFDIQDVYLQGRPWHTCRFRPIPSPPNSMRIAPVTAADFQMVAGSGRIQVIGIIANQIVTENRRLAPNISNGRPIADALRDIAKLAVIERHRGSGQMGLGFVQGLGLARGAIAATIAHDSHNLIVAGMTDDDMAAAAMATAARGGGLVVVHQGQVLAHLPLPIAGLMSDQPIETVYRDFQQVLAACRQLGAVRNPFMVLSFLALPVIPSLKLTDCGLVDVEAFQLTDLWENDAVAT